MRLLPASLLLAVLALPLAAQRGPVPGLTTAAPYLIYYGDWTDTQAGFARDNYRLVILHPSVTNVTPAQIATIQAGPDMTASTADDVPVLAYISVGEDDRPGSPFAGDGTGPRVDPRAADSDPLAGIAPLGDPSPGGTGFASYYLDDGVIGDPNSVANDGTPDRNQTFGGYYVNPGDPAWFTILRTRTKTATGRAGFDELLTTTGNGYNCDGLFLDTLDTPAPNSFGATRFEWTSPGYQSLLAQVSSTYPSKLLLGNRGLFFYNPNFKNYEFTLRPYLDLVLFESYYTDSSGSGAPSVFFDDNKHSYAPKLNAEAQRADGFSILALGYTTPGEPAVLGEDDFWECHYAQGWPLYRTNPALNTTPFNTDADQWNFDFGADLDAPTWDSTAAFGADSDPGTPGNQPPIPRVGIQQAEAGDGQVTIRWDVARDRTGPVRYNIYHTGQPSLAFGTAAKLAAVTPDIPANYLTGAGPGRYPFEFTVSGLANGTTHRFAVRAEDALGNEDGNVEVLAATPDTPASEFRSITIDGSFADWAVAPVLGSDPAEAIDPDFADLSVANDADYLYIRFTLHNASTVFTDINSHLFIDTDNDAGTGFPVGGSTIGSDFMVESFGAALAGGYDERSGGFNDGGVNGINWNISPTGSGTEFELRVSRNSTYASDSAPVFSSDTIRVLLQHNSGDITAPAGILYKFAPPPPPPSNFAAIDLDGDPADWAPIPATVTDPSGDGVQDVTSIKVANDDEFLYLLIEYAAATDTNNLNGSPSVFLSCDNDHDTGTGFDIYGFGQVGADVSWQNDHAFASDAANFNLHPVPGVSFTNALPLISPYYSNTRHQEYAIRRDATFTVGAGAEQDVFPQDLIALAVWTDKEAAEFAGAFDYQFATNPGTTVYQQWKLQNFTPAQLADPLASGDDADLDRDGIPTLLEFALGLDPRIQDLQGLPTGSLISIGPDLHLAITFTRRPPADGVTYAVESSSNLSDWDNSPGQFVEASTMPLPNGLQQVTIRLTTPLSGGPEFLRLRVDLN